MKVKQMDASELLTKYMCVKVAILYSNRKGCKCRDKLLDGLVKNIKGLVPENSEIQILANIIFGAGYEGRTWKQREEAYDRALDLLNKEVRKKAMKMKQKGKGSAE